MNNVCTFYIVRHGQSEDNANEIKGKVMGQDPLGSDLTKLGIIQAGKVAVELKDVHFDKVYSSDLKRAHKTAEIIVKERELAIETTEILRERSRGKLVDELEKKLAAKTGNIFNEMELMSKEEQLALKKDYAVELREETTSRVITFLREIAVSHPNQTLLITCHGAVMRSLLIHFGYGLPTEMASGSVANASYFIVESDGVDFFLQETFGITKKHITSS